MSQTAPAPVASATATPPGPPHEPRRAGGAIVAILAFCGIAVSVMQTLVIPLVTELPQLLHTTASNASWVITATLLSGAVATPVMGRLGDMFGKRRVLVASLVLLVVGSLICATTSQLAPMVVGRAVQGGAMGAIPLGISIMRDELPPQRLGSAMALMSSSLGIGGALGLPAAAFVAQHSSWHVLFYGAAGLGAISILLVLSAVPESSARTPGRFDLVGAVGLSAGLVCLLLPITKGSDWGWGSSTTLGLFAAAAVILILWGLLELRIAMPLVDLRTTARRQVLLTNLASILVGFSFYGMMLVLPEVLELPQATGYGLGQSLVVAGLCVAPMGVAMMLVSPLSARINTTAGPKVSMMAGLVVIGAGYGGGIFMLSAVWQIVVVATVIGAGIGLAYAAMPTLIIGAVPASETGAANGLNTLMRSIGTSSSSAVVGLVLAHQTTRFRAVDLPTMHGFKLAFAILGCSTVVGLLIALFLPSSRRGAAGAARGAAAEAGIARPAETAGSGPTGSQESAAVAETAGAGTSAGAGTTSAGAAATPAARPGEAAARGAIAGGGTAGRRETAGHGRMAGRREPAGHGRMTGHGNSGMPAVSGRELPGHVIRGRVLGLGGGPLSDAAITVIDTAGHQLGRAVSAADGRYSVQIQAAGSVMVIGSAAGHQPQAAAVLVTATPVACDLRLPAGAGLTGTVRALGGGAVHGAVATATDAGGTVAGFAAADAQGAFELSDLGPGAYALTISAPGYRPHASEVRVTGGRPARVEAELRPSATMRGTVRDRAGQPLLDARVSLLDAVGEVVGACVTDERGAFGFEGLTSDQYTVVAGGYAPMSTPVAVGGARGTVDVQDVDFLLTHG
jgi:MFS family permease